MAAFHVSACVMQRSNLWQYCQMRMLKRVLVGLLIVIALLAAVVFGFAWWFTRGQKNSVLVDFHPASFAVKASHPFFYSFGDELKYSDNFDPSSPTLYKGAITDFLVSPDGDKIAAVTKGELLIISQAGGTFHVASVNSIYRDKPRIGTEFFRDQEFQWSEDSENLFLVHDKFYASVGSQLFSDFGELWKYNLASRAKELVLRPFPADEYFFGKSGIYFSVPTAVGDLQLRFFDGKRTIDIGDSTIPHFADSIPNLPDNDIFYSFEDYDYLKTSAAPDPVRSSVDNALHTETYEVNGHTLFRVREGIGFKGPGYCGDSEKKRYTPGYGYALLDQEYCGGYSGEVLVDVKTGAYEALPAGTRLFVTINTFEYRSFRVTGGGIVP